MCEERGGEGRPGGSVRAEGTEGRGGEGRQAEGCGELSATGGGRGQLPELGSRVVIRGWMGEERAKSRPHAILHRRGARRVARKPQSRQKSGLQTAEREPTPQTPHCHRPPPPSHRP